MNHGSLLHASSAGHRSNLYFMVIAFNLFQLFLFRRLEGFRELRMSQSMVVE